MPERSRTTRLSSPLALVVLVAGLSSPARAAESCTLTKPLKVSVKKDGKAVWETVASGGAVEVKSRGPTWTTVVTPAGPGKVATSALEQACASADGGAKLSMPTVESMKLKPQPAAPAPVVAAPAIVVPQAPVATTSAPAPAPEEVRATTERRAPAAAGEEKLAAVLDLRAGPGSEKIAQALTTVLTAEVGALPDTRAVSRTELKAILAHQADASLLGCESVNCMADVAKLADASLVVSGSVDQVQDAHVLSLTLVDPSGPRILERQEVAWRGDPDEMLSLVRPYVDRLFAGAEASQRAGSLEVFAPAGALVVIDGKEVGRAPLAAPVHGLPTGAHALLVSLEGHETYKHDVIVTRNETAIARVELIEEPLTSQWWFWTAAGGTALVAVGVASGLTAWGIVEGSKSRSSKLTLVP
jgi:hypothetical protein